MSDMRLSLFSFNKKEIFPLLIDLRSSLLPASSSAEQPFSCDPRILHTLSLKYTEDEGNGRTGRSSLIPASRSAGRSVDDTRNTRKAIRL